MTIQLAPRTVGYLSRITTIGSKIPCVYNRIVMTATDLYQRFPNTPPYGPPSDGGINILDVVTYVVVIAGVVSLVGFSLWAVMKYFTEDLPRR